MGRMTIDEAIKMHKDITNTDAYCPRYCMRPCEDCVQECEQLAEWLEELKELRLQNHLGRDEALIAGRKEGYNKAIDDFIHECDKYCRFYSGDNKNLTREDMLSIAERLKAGGENNGF